MEQEIITETIIKHKKRRRRKKKSAPIVVYLDTEFNAFDYYGQNQGCQEILQIGAVAYRDGVMIDGFQTYCALKKGHLLSKRSMSLTSIRKSDLKNAPDYPKALSMMNEFLAKHEPAFIFAYGSEDKTQMLNSAKLHKLPKEETVYIERIEDNMKRLSLKLGTKKRTKLTLSVKDLCEICEVKADKPHDAYNDAIYLAECSEMICAGKFDPENVQTLLDKKTWMSDYRMSRRIKDVNETVMMEDADLAPIRALIESLRDDKVYPDYQLKALYDDILAISGREPEI